MLLRLLSVLALVCSTSVQAEAAQVCAWLLETNQPDDVRMLNLWLQSDSDVDFLYQIGGDGIVTGSGRANSPSSATFSLIAGKAERAWGFGATFDAPGKIDVTVDLHKIPADIFSDAPTPLLARFSFQRDIPTSETKPADLLAKKQCTPLAAP